MPAAYWSPDMLIHVAFTATALAFLVRDILWLRLLATFSYSLFLVLALARAEGPVWSLIYWYVAFMAINIGHAAYLFYERSLEKLKPEERRLCALAFATLDLVPVKRLMHAGVWLDLEPGHPLTRKGRISKHLWLIAQGEVTVRVDDQEIARLPAGRFVGEIGFLAASAATATAVASADGGDRPVRCLAWDQKKLRRRLARDPAMRAVMYAAIGADLSAKVAEHNVKVRRPTTAEMAAAGRIGG